MGRVTRACINCKSKSQTMFVKHRDPSEPNELISTVLDDVARDYFRHAIRKQRPPRQPR